MSLSGTESKKKAGVFKYYTDINISGDSKLRLKKELAVGRWITCICAASNSRQSLAFKAVHGSTLVCLLVSICFSTTRRWTAPAVLIDQTVKKNKNVTSLHKDHFTIFSAQDTKQQKHIICSEKVNQTLRT